MFALSASQAHDSAIRALAELLTRLKLDFAFVGSVGRAAWLGTPVTTGPVDAVVLMGPQQKNSVVMMAMNRGFTADTAEIEASEELDLIPLTFGGIRIHILVGSNALYGRMVAASVPAQYSEMEIRIPGIEDFALLLQMSDDLDGVIALAETEGFDLAGYNRKLTSIGLREVVLHE